jgi:glucose/arabinose dehydrogenase
MAGSDHTSRTLLLSKKAPGLIVINRGSNSNIDPEASSITTGHSQVKAFNLTNATGTPYDFNTNGLLLGWGLRNDVGIDEEPLYGGIYSVENSADQISRNDVDIHSNNPAEELNFLGYLNGTYSANQGRNFGYPECFTAWNTSAIPNFNGTVGQQFAIGKWTRREAALGVSFLSNFVLVLSVKSNETLHPFPNRNGISNDSDQF